MFSSTYLLQSVSEEKENRMIEIMLSNMTSRELIWGKILGQIAIVFTQLFVLLSLAAIGLYFTLSNNPLPIDLSDLNLTVGQVLLGVFYLFTGFMIMATTMVGVGSSMPTYREASSFSSVFILTAVSPLWFASTIIFEPSGLAATITSYIPFTAPMILMFRNALGELSTLELLFSSGVLVIYVMIGLFLSFKLFEFGSLQYSSRINFQDFLRSFFSRKSK